mgnify:CR=1 FL=1
MTYNNSKLKTLVQTPKLSNFKTRPASAGYLNFDFCIVHFKFKKGFTLLEIVVYVALVGIISVFVTNSLIQIADTYNRVRAEREVVSNARLMQETINSSIREAQEIYGPTSRFYNNAGQLSLIIPSPTTVHSTSYVDFWIDNGLFLMKREGQTQLILSAPTIRVAKFNAEQIIQGIGREAVRVTLQVDFANPRFPASVTLNSTTALRGNY